MDPKSNNLSKLSSIFTGMVMDEAIKDKEKEYQDGKTPVHSPMPKPLPKLMLA